MEQIAPTRLAEDWDNVGLLAGERDRRISRILLCIDFRETVLAEAIRGGSDAVIAYHPPIFKPISRLDDRSADGRVLLGAFSAGIAIYSPHTAADAAEDGVNDWLATAFGTGQRTPLTPDRVLAPTQQFKIVTFCPPAACEGVREGLAAAGAGVIGAYEGCSFQIPGTGTFIGGEGSNPSIGVPGRFEQVEEIRLEMVCGSAQLPEAIAALRTRHPYEEPPVEVFPLAPQPTTRTGAGRRVVLEKAASFDALAEDLRNHLGTRRLIGHEPAPRRKHTSIGFCAGSGGSLLDDAIEAGCTLFVTGEMRHHDVLKAEAHGCAVLLAGHTNTERGWLKVLRKRLGRMLRNPEEKVEISLARSDSDLLRPL
ncbi:MAG: Nif3-like dinuclear metal center hexameric protein [Phycisphaerales bacterium]|nr:Nif3-like dinuclear metal center hexameric protein [Phycisphaerales bacterium]